MSVFEEPTTLRKVAIITGVNGQDGSYLAELLLRKDYIVHGLVRPGSVSGLARIKHLRDQPLPCSRFFLHYCDLTDAVGLAQLIAEVRPCEVYNLAAMSQVKASFDNPEYTADVDGVGTLRLISALRRCGLDNSTRFYQASTSELYGKAQQSPQNEMTPFYPCSPYGVAKLYAHWIVVNYREAYGMFLVNGILFNHESPRRGPEFVTRKITLAVARIKKGLQRTLYLGNLDVKRDWGHARDYVKGMWMMLQADVPSDFVLATGESHSVREFVEKAFTHVGIALDWKGERGTVTEVGVARHDLNHEMVRIDPAYFRPTEVDNICGDPTKAKKILNWEPQTTFDSLVKEMVDGDMQLVETQGTNI